MVSLDSFLPRKVALISLESFMTRKVANDPKGELLAGVGGKWFHGRASCPGRW
jgi:hypothetical protein